MRTCITSLFLALAAVTLCFSTSDAGRRKRVKPQPKQIEIVNRPFSIVPFLKGGFITGAVTEYVDNNDRALWGGGLRLERFISPIVRVDLGVEALYGKFAGPDGAKVRGTSLSAGSCLMFTPQKQSGLYGRIEVGLTSLKVLDTRIAAPTYSFIRFGIGQSYYSRPSVTTRIEVFYSIIMSKDRDHFPMLGTVDFNMTYVGLQLGFLFGL